MVIDMWFGKIFKRKESVQHDWGEGEIVRKHFIFKGRVQGVGFRYRAKYAADGLGITGWVRNEYDGSVEMEAQGYEEAINRMLTMLNSDSYIRIESITSEQIPLKERERSFSADYDF